MLEAIGRIDLLPEIQYAHARVCSVVKQWGDAGGNEAELAGADLGLLTHPRELAVAARRAFARKRIRRSANKPGLL